MKMISSLSALALAAALAAAPAGIPAALAQDSGSDAAVDCPELGVPGSESVVEIEDESERVRALSCLVGTPRDYQAEVSEREAGSEIRTYNVEELWGEEVAEGLRASAEANAAATGDLEAAVESDPEMRQAITEQTEAGLMFLGFQINLDGTTDLFFTPIRTGALETEGDAMGAEGGAMESESDAMETEGNAAQ